MNTDKVDVEELVEGIGGRNFAAFWWATEDHSDDFLMRKKYFFIFIDVLLSHKHIKLTKNSKIVDDNVKEILFELDGAFPKTEEEMQDGLWFYFDECVWSIVWLPGDGTVFWTA